MRLFLIISVLYLCSCSTLTKSQCKSEKWLEIGFVDAKNKRADNFYTKHIAACDSGDFKEDQYKKGWEQGTAAGADSENNNDLNSAPTPEQVTIENENFRQVKALAIGSVIGLGSGHLLQGTYTERGWIYTLLEGSMLFVPVKGLVLLGFVGVKAYEILDLSQFFYRYKLFYPIN